MNKVIITKAICPLCAHSMVIKEGEEAPPKCPKCNNGKSIVYTADPNEIAKMRVIWGRSA